MQRQIICRLRFDAGAGAYDVSGSFSLQFSLAVGQEQRRSVRPSILWISAKMAAVNVGELEFLEIAGAIGFDAAKVILELVPRRRRQISGPK
jgi:hypothetical protein